MPTASKELFDANFVIHLLREFGIFVSELVPGEIIPDCSWVTDTGKTDGKAYHVKVGLDPDLVNCPVSKCKNRASYYVTVLDGRPETAEKRFVCTSHLAAMGVSAVNMKAYLDRMNAAIKDYLLDRMFPVWPENKEEQDKRFPKLPMVIF